MKHPAPLFTEQLGDVSEDHPENLAVVAQNIEKWRFIRPVNSHKYTLRSETLNPTTCSNTVAFYYCIICELIFLLTMKLISEKKPGKCKLACISLC